MFDRLSGGFLVNAHADHYPQTAGALTADKRRWVVLALLGFAQFMLIIDVTVVNVALPSIGRDLGLDRSGLTWTVTAYTLVFGSLLLLGGRLADSFGRRTMFLTGLGLFTASSLASGLAPDGTVLVAARAAQGIGAALLSPAALSIITTTFQGSERARALGVWAALAGSGAAVGVVLGGLLAAGPGWQWIFFINVPVGIAVGVGVVRLVTAGAASRGVGSLDIPGVLAAAATVGLLLFGLIGAGDEGWGSISTLGALSLAVATGALFVWLESVASVPLVRLEMLGRRALSASLAVFLAASGLLGAAFFLNSLYLQRLLGLSALEVGLAFLPVALATIFGAHLASNAIVRVGGRPTALIGLTLAALGAAYLTRLPAHGDVIADVLPGFIALAGGIGMTFVSATTTAFSEVAHHDAGTASGLVNTSHELGLALGVAIASTVAAGSLAGSGGVAGFQTAFLALATVAVAALPGAVLLPAGRLTTDTPILGH
jgi:EmrB/QacA subfamily drug resistance transporter